MRGKIGLVTSLGIMALALATPLAAKDKPPGGTEAAVEVMVPAETVTGFRASEPTDYDLENIIYAAYRAARESALVNENYFVYGDVTADDLRLMMIRDLVRTGYTGLTIAYDEAADFSTSRQCAEPGTTELRIHYTDDGVGISLVAVSDSRYAAYDYDPDVSAELVITSPTDCEPVTGGM